MNRVFVISDTHFNHTNIIDYCHRPFSSVEEMNEVLIRNWNKVVRNSDKIFCLGDFCLGSKDMCREITSRLNGFKTLIIGNHDRWNKKFYEECGFDEVCKRPTIYDRHIILSHAPLKMTDCKFDDIKVYNIYGHIHNNVSEGGNNTNSYCVSVENVDYTPILIDEVIRRIDEVNKL